MVKQSSGNPSRFRKMILLFIIAGAAVLLISPVSAETGVTISARGDQSYYLGEEVVLNGTNYDSGYTYLFITGPGISPDGGKLTAPLQNVISGDPVSFDRVQTKPDKSWEYPLYTYNLGINPGPYAIYAASQPKTASQLTGADNKSAKVIFKKPFITAEVTPPAIARGQPFTVTGYAEGNPGAVQLWIFGDNYVFDTAIPTSPNQSYTFSSASQILANLPKGPCYLIVQHPMQNNKLDIVRSGDWVQNLQLNGGSARGMNLFRITGAGSLPGRDAAEAHIAALNDKSVDDTYTEIPLYVADNTGTKNEGMNEASFAGATPLQAQAPAAPVQQQTQASPLQFAPLGAIVVISVIALWSRR